MTFWSLLISAEVWGGGAPFTGPGQNPGEDLGGETTRNFYNLVVLQSPKILKNPLYSEYDTIKHNTEKNC